MKKPLIEQIKKSVLSLIEQMEKEPTLSDQMVSYEELANLFHWFHISSIFLGDQFTFSPRIPRRPARDKNDAIIEDDFTKRVSVAPTIDTAVKALGQKSAGTYVYAIDLKADPSDDVASTDLSKQLRKCEKVLSYTDQKRGVYYNYLSNRWTLEGWLNNFLYVLAKDKSVPDEKLDWFRTHQVKAPSNLEPAFRELFKACVPDADSTGENWLRKPSNFIFLGRRIGNGVQLSKNAKEEIERLSKELNISLPWDGEITEDQEKREKLAADLEGTQPVKTADDMTLKKIATGRVMKKLFAKYADHSFMDSLKTIHWMPYGKALIPLLKSPTSSKDELSCSAYLSVDDIPDQGVWMNKVGLVVKGRITYLANTMDDIISGNWEEYTGAYSGGEAGEKIKQRFRSSGANKGMLAQPAASAIRSTTRENPVIVLDKEDYNPKKLGNAIYNEALVDNWKPLAVIITPEKIKEYPPILDRLKELNIFYGTYEEVKEYLKGIS